MVAITTNWVDAKGCCRFSKWKAHGAATLAAFVASMTVVFLSPLSAQQPAFEVASVRQNTTPQDNSLGPGSVAWRLTRGNVDILNISLKEIIALAYGVEETVARVKIDYKRVPENVLFSRFDIHAKGEGDQRAMLQTLLAERFQLRTQTEVRQAPIYALTIARKGRLGPGLRPSPYNCREISVNRKRSDPDTPPPCRPSARERGSGVRFERFAGTINDLISMVAQSSFDLPVVDMTGLDGNFEWELAFSRSNRPDAEGPTIRDAFENQLGLKFESQTGPWEVIVIDDVEMPTPN